MAGTALAQSQAEPAPARTRAQVVAELVAARANGELRRHAPGKGRRRPSPRRHQDQRPAAHAITACTRVTAEEIAEAHAANGERVGNFELVAPRKRVSWPGR